MVRLPRVSLVPGDIVSMGTMRGGWSSPGMEVDGLGSVSILETTELVLLDARDEGFDFTGCLVAGSAFTANLCTEPVGRLFFCRRPFFDVTA